MNRLLTVTVSVAVGFISQMESRAHDTAMCPLRSPTSTPLEEQLGRAKWIRESRRRPAMTDCTTGIVQQLAAERDELRAKFAAAEALLREAVKARTSTTSEMSVCILRLGNG